ncbi:uncharacterized protein KGF55_005403 [Candida pseudojiufengensis]|uniref:uncharacterized protein n=1 Tax=Candida pseudojiufengensis TaxID=497109 RepID=UPI0022257C0C|nr:uncharacterized protein KGF55_005403 [Candida pseudojiufengensis]KAI5959425.1 hypothetical protein KGF55_005403 [Candida pseudojiufengensis]
MSSDQFKAVGIATIKGIGKGSKSLGQAGYRTYKKHEAKRNGTEYVDPIKKEDKLEKEGSPNDQEYTPYVAKPLPTKESLQAFAPPPKRNVGTYSVKDGKYASPQSTSNQYQTQPQQQYQQQPQQQYQQPQQPQQQYQQPQQQYQQPQQQYQQQYQQPQQQYQQPQQQYQQQYQQPQQQYQQPQQQYQQQQFQQEVQPPNSRPQPQPQSYTSQHSQAVLGYEANYQTSTNSTPIQDSQQYQQSSQQYSQLQPNNHNGQSTNELNQNNPPPVYQPHDQLRDQNTIPPITYTPNQQIQSYQQQDSSTSAQPQTSHVNTVPQPTPQFSSPIPNYTQNIHQSTQQIEPPVEQQKPKKPAPDPRSFAPPPIRGNAAPSTPPRSSNRVYTNSTASKGSQTSLNSSSTSHSQPPVLPSRSSAHNNSSLISNEMPNKPVSQPLNLNSLPPPPQIYRGSQEQIAKSTKNNKPDKSKVSGIESETNESAAPPMPIRPTNAPAELTPPPMPSRKSVDLNELAQKKKPPPKPMKKPKLDSDFRANKGGSDVSNELETMFKKMNMKNISNSDSISEKDTLQPVKAKPSIGTKPTLKQKPEIKPKVPVATLKTPNEASVPSSASVSSPSKELTPPPVPKPRTYKRQAVPIPSQQLNKPPDLDLELETQWFANRDKMQLPRSLQGLNYQTNYSYSTHGSIERNNRIITIRLKDLSILSYKFEWESNKVSGVKVTIDKFIPSPLFQTPTKEELISNNERFGNYIAAWSEHHKGQQVGNGECWDLAKYALSKGCGNHAFVSTYYIHGYPILQIGKNYHFLNGSTQLDEIRRGDILQFKSCKFFNPQNGSSQTVGMPDHTSIVTGVIGDKIKVVEQNVNGIRKVKDGEYIPKNLVEGELYVYRVMPAEWAGTL